MSRFFVSIFLIHLAFALASPAAGEVKVFLDNGDTITGELLEAGAETLTLSVGYLGEVALPRERVVKVEGEPEEAALAEAESDEETAVAGESTSTREEQSENLAEAEGEEALPVESLDPEQGWVAGALAWLESFDSWDKRLQLGLNSSSGRKELKSYNYRFDMNRRLEKSQVNFNTELSYAKASGSKTVDRSNSRLRWRKDFAPGVYYESLTGYMVDEIKLIDSSFEQKLGLGTRFLDSDDSTLSAGLGASGRWRELAGSSQDVAYLLDLSQDWDYRMSERIRVKQDFSFAVPLEESKDYEVTFSAALTSDVTEAINVSIRYEIGYDNSLAEGLKEDRRFVSSLGYAF